MVYITPVRDRKNANQRSRKPTSTGNLVRERLHEKFGEKPVSTMEGSSATASIV